MKIIEKIAQKLADYNNNKECDAGYEPIDWLDVPGYIQRSRWVDLNAQHPVVESIVHYQKGVVDVMKKRGYKIGRNNHVFMQSLIINLAATEEWYSSMDEEKGIKLRKGQLSDRQVAFAEQALNYYELYRTCYREPGKPTIKYAQTELFHNAAMEVLKTLPQAIPEDHQLVFGFLASLM